MPTPRAAEISDAAIKTMTAEALSRAGVALRLELEVPAGSGKKYDLLMVPTRDLKKFQGRADIVATYLEVEGVCKAHHATKDDRINIDSIIGLVRFRERAAAEGVGLMAIEVGASECSTS